MITGKHLLCFFLLAFPLSWAEDTMKDIRDTENDTDLNEEAITLGRMDGFRYISTYHLLSLTDLQEEHSDMVHIWSQAKARRLFARRKISPPQESEIPKHKSNLMTPARRCGRLMESCSSHLPCCDPCASCRCRLFNTICHCWRTNPLCLKRT